MGTLLDFLDTLPDVWGNITKAEASTRVHCTINTQSCSDMYENAEQAQFIMNLDEEEKIK